jgi:hypothetical protein
MARPKNANGRKSQLTIRVTPDEIEQMEDLKRRTELRSTSDVVRYLLAVVKRHRDDQEDMMYALVDRLGHHIERRFQSLNTMQQLNLALNDAFMKYVVSALPHVPDELKDTARLRGMNVYNNLNAAAVKEFQRRRKGDAYSDASLGIEEESSNA